MAALALAPIREAPAWSMARPRPAEIRLPYKPWEMPPSVGQRHIPWVDKYGSKAVLLCFLTQLNHLFFGHIRFQQGMVNHTCGRMARTFFLSPFFQEFGHFRFRGHGQSRTDPGYRQGGCRVGVNDSFLQ